VGAGDELRSFDKQSSWNSEIARSAGFCLIKITFWEIKKSAEALDLCR